MKNSILARALCLCTLMLPVLSLPAQTYYQYFDGADTLSTSIIVNIVPGSHNIWQIGRPHKAIFNSAATLPNAIVTDTVNNYPNNDTSSFIISTHPYWGAAPIYAYQWKQKLDLYKRHDGAIIEYSADSGATWHNVFHDPGVYSFYGFNPYNADTLNSGEYAFSGTDTTWRDIWLCFSGVATMTDSMLLRFTLKTDSIDSNKEGWLIDNFSIHPTWIHTATKILKEIDHIMVYPTITGGIVNITTKRPYKLTTIEEMQLIDVEGRIVREYGSGPIAQTIDVSSYADGLYYLKIRTNIGSDTYKLILKR